MLTVKIYNDFLHSPIWTYDEDGVVVSDPLVIEKDERLQELCNCAEEMYSSYFEFNSHDQGCWFDIEKEKSEKSTMIEIIHKIIFRLSEINDGSFVIEDCETERLNNL